jgi:chemotaxis signal transduction protein
MQTADGGRPEERSDARDSVAFVRFRLGGFPLALEAGHVERVLGAGSAAAADEAVAGAAPAPELTRLPGAAEPVVGMGYVAGRPMPVVSLADRLDIEPADADGERPVVVVRSGAGPAVGLLADGTSGLRTAPVDGVTPPGESGDFFLGDATGDPLFRAVVAFDDGTAYALAPTELLALADRGEPP